MTRTVGGEEPLRAVSSCAVEGPGAMAERVDWTMTGSFYPLSDPARGIEVCSGTADVFAIAEDGWYPLGALRPGSVITGCAPVRGWRLGVRRATDVVLRPFDLEEEQGSFDSDAERRSVFIAGLEATLSVLSVDTVGARALPPRDFDVLTPGESEARRGDVLRPIDSWIWVRSSAALGVCSVALENGEEQGGESSSSSWMGLGRHDWLHVTRATTIHAATTGELFDQNLLGGALADHLGALLRSCSAGVARRHEERRDRIDAAARREREQVEKTSRANRRLASGGTRERELGDLLGPWGTAIARALQPSRRQMTPSSGIMPALRAARSFDEVGETGWVRLRPLKLVDGWWRSPQATPFVTSHGPVRTPCTITFKGNRPWVQLWNDLEARPLEHDDLSVIDAEAHVVEEPLPSWIRTVRGLLRFSFAGSGKDAVSLASCAGFVMMLSVVTPLVSGLVIGRLVQLSEIHVIVQIGCVMLLLSLLTAGLQTVQNHLALRLKGRMAQRLGSGIWAKLLSLPLPFFESRSPGGLGTVILNMRQAQEAISGAVVSSVMGLTVAFADLLVLVAVSPAIAAGVGAVLLVSAALHARLLLRDIAAQRSYMSTQQDVSGLTLAVLSTMPKIRAAGAEQRVLARWGRIQREALRHQIASRRAEAWVMVATSLLMPVVIAVVVTVGSATVATSDRTSIITAIMASQLLTTNFIQFVSVFQVLAPVVPMFEFLRPILEEAPECGEGKAQPGELSGDVRLHEVSFRYGADGPLVLDRISLTIHRGEFVAIVGASGSGKSTLLRMLIGFDRPDSGSVIYDGQDLAELDAAAVRRQCGIVLQSNGMVSGSIRDNICGSGAYGDSEVWEAAEMAGVADDIRAMPMRLSTHVTDGASGLSGGQRQRLMIARALISRPRIVIFDEATSALDNPTQTVVMESMRRLNATRIVVAHRLSTVRDADRIVVIDHGRVVESGTFDELQEANGFFARMAEAQQAEAGIGPHA